MSAILRQTAVLKVSFPGGSAYSDAFDISAYAWGMFYGLIDSDYLAFYVSHLEDGDYYPVARTTPDNSAELVLAAPPSETYYVAIPDEVMAARWVKFAAVDSGGTPSNVGAETFTVILKT